MGLRSALPLLALTAALGVAAPPVAAETRAWQDSLPLAAPDANVNDYELVVTSSGEAVMAWIDQGGESIRAFTAVLRADGTLDPPVQVAKDLAGCVLDLAADARGNAILVLSHADGQIDAYRRPAGGSFGDAEIVRPGGVSWGEPKVAMNPAGDAAVMTRGGHGGSASTWLFVSRGGGPWSAEREISGYTGTFGGFDVAMTPSGDAVGLWINDGAERPDRISTVSATTVRADGSQSAVQTLRSSTSLKSCPQLEANALGQVAALWHEIEGNFCGAWGGDVLALRPAGATAFETPQLVPGDQSATARGKLGLADDGRLTVSYDGYNAPQIVSGPFGGQLIAQPLESAPVALGTDPSGGDIVALWNHGDSFATRRQERDGRLAPPQPARFDGRISDTIEVDQAGGRAFAMVHVEGQGLRAMADAPAPDPPPPPQPPAAAPPPPRATTPDFSAAVLRIRRAGRMVAVTVACSARCTATVRLTLRGRNGRTVRRTSRARSLVHAGMFRFRLPRAAMRRLGARPRLTARLSAVAPTGERAEAVLRRRR